MLRHQLRQDFVLALHLFLQVLDAFLLGLVVGAGFGLEGGGPVFEELLLSAVKHRRLQAKLVTELGNWLLLQQMPPQGGDFLFPGVMLSCFLHVLSPLS